MSSRRTTLAVLKTRRQAALDRPELRVGTEPRRSPASPVSMPVKEIDPATRALIDAAIAARTEGRR